MNIELNSKLRRYLEAQVKSGRYADVSAAVNGAVSQALDQETLRPKDVAELRRQIRIGIDAADRGSFVDFTADDIIAKGRRILAARRRQRARKRNTRGNA